MIILIARVWQLGNQLNQQIQLNRRQSKALEEKLNTSEYAIKGKMQEQASQLQRLSYQISEDFSHIQHLNAKLSAAQRQIKLLAPYRHHLRQHEHYIQTCINALNCGDRSRLRDLTTAELDITGECEIHLQQNSFTQPTRLKISQGSGSYLLITFQERAWLLPTVQTLTAVALHQPPRGIFIYTRKPLSSAELIKPADLRDVDGLWEVSEKGEVMVPG